MFELKGSGRLLTVRGQCLTVQRNSYVVVDTCALTLSGQQRWSYDATSGRLTNTWSEYCATHVTDPEAVESTKQRRQILMAQNCTVDLNNGQTHDRRNVLFRRWKFTNP